MSGKQQARPGFHAIMMAAAYAEEGLHEHAVQALREAGGNGSPRSRPADPPPLRAWAGRGGSRPASPVSRV